MTKEVGIKIAENVFKWRCSYLQSNHVQLFVGGFVCMNDMSNLLSSKF